MARLTIMFESFGNAMGRVYHSMSKHLPEDMEIVQVVTRDTKVIRDTDLVIAHCGGSEYKPSYAFMSPKLVLTEACDPVTGSYYGERDLMWVYDPVQAEQLRAQGVNALLLPRPVDTEIFFKPEPMPEKTIDVLSVGPHDASVVLPVYEAAIALNMSFQALTGLHFKEMEEMTDLCEVGTDDDKMRDYYNRAKYSLALFPAYPYYKDVWTNGIEIASVEAIFCGSRPIVFDVPEANYMRYWLGDAALYIDRDDLREELLTIFRGEYVPPTDEQIARVKTIFNAKDMWSIVWSRVREVLA